VQRYSRLVVGTEQTNDGDLGHNIIKGNADDSADVEDTLDAMRRRLYGPFVDIRSSIKTHDTLDSVENEFEKMARTLKMQK